MKTIIHNALIVNEGRRFIGWVAIEEGFIVKVADSHPSPQQLSQADETIDAEGAYLLPGAIDTHVHFREPGLTHKADIASESAAAVAGGVTSYLEMPNTKPPTTDIEAWQWKMDRAAQTSVANYAFFIGATNANTHTLLKADYTRIPGVKLFMGSSTGNMLVDRGDALESLFARFRGVIAVHAEDESIIRANREKLMAEYGEDAPVTIHASLRSRQACVEATRRAVELARRHNSRLHVLHISTADELRLFSAGDIGAKRITAETCPHYLTFTADSLTAPRGYVRKCNPAIKDSADRRALIDAVASGVIDVIATDHAPHLLSEKQGSLWTAASGMPGVKMMLPVMLDLSADRSNHLSIERVVELTAHNPARLYGIDRRGFIREGYHADLVIIKAGSPRVITDADASSHIGSDRPRRHCDWTPYAGLTRRHQVIMTMVNGHRAFHDGLTDPTPHSNPLKFNI